MCDIDPSTEYDEDTPQGNRNALHELEKFERLFFEACHAVYSPQICSADALVCAVSQEANRRGNVYFNRTLSNPILNKELAEKFLSQCAASSYPQSSAQITPNPQFATAASCAPPLSSCAPPQNLIDDELGSLLDDLAAEYDNQLGDGYGTYYQFAQDPRNLLSEQPTNKHLAVTTNTLPPYADAFLENQLQPAASNTMCPPYDYRLVRPQTEQGAEDAPYDHARHESGVWQPDGGDRVMSSYQQGKVQAAFEYTREPPPTPVLYLELNAEQPQPSSDAQQIFPLQHARSHESFVNCASEPVGYSRDAGDELLHARRQIDILGRKLEEKNAEVDRLRRENAQLHNQLRSQNTSPRHDSADDTLKRIGREAHEELHVLLEKYTDASSPPTNPRSMDTPSPAIEDDTTETCESTESAPAVTVSPAEHQEAVAMLRTRDCFVSEREWPKAFDGKPIPSDEQFERILGGKLYFTLTQNIFDSYVYYPLTADRRNAQM